MHKSGRRSAQRGWDCRSQYSRLRAPGSNKVDDTFALTIIVATLVNEKGFAHARRDSVSQSRALTSASATVVVKRHFIRRDAVNQPQELISHTTKAAIADRDSSPWTSVHAADGKIFEGIV